jgi:hypothetical protein
MPVFYFKTLILLVKNTHKNDPKKALQATKPLA